MPYFFSPPLSETSTSKVDMDPKLRKTNPNGNNLARHFESRPRAVNVWILADGTLTEVQPFGAAYDVRQGVYLGGHDYTVTTAERDALVAAGYTVTGSP